MKHVCQMESFISSRDVPEEDEIVLGAYRAGKTHLGDQFDWKILRYFDGAFWSEDFVETKRVFSEIFRVECSADDGALYSGHFCLEQKPLVWFRLPNVGKIELIAMRLERIGL